jgi:hypothetical protein
VKRTVLAAAAAIVLAAVVAVTVPASAATVVLESFESGFGQWRPDTDAHAPTATVTISGEQAHDGAKSVKIFMDGRKDDGTTWIETQLTGPRNARLRVTLSFQLWSAGAGVAGGWIVVGHAGTIDPEAETDFTRIDYTEVVAGWRPYVRGWTIRTDNTGKFWVALGTSVVWEVQKFHFIDSVRVDVVSF